jgi:hypothetical protein
LITSLEYYWNSKASPEQVKESDDFTSSYGRRKKKVSSAAEKNLIGVSVRWIALRMLPY